MRSQTIFAICFATCLSAGAAHAGLIGEKVHGTIALGPDGADPTSDWGTPTISNGLEFSTTNGIQRYSANFRDDDRLVIRDMERPNETSSGWEMTFKLTGDALKRVALRKSDFDGALTYSIKNHVLTVDWAGDAAYLTLTGKERRALGPQKFEAVFKIVSKDSEDSPAAVSVPEPGSVALLGAGLFSIFAFGQRRKAAA